MKWIKKEFSSFKNKKDWIIYLSQLGSYHLIGITVPVSQWRNLSSIYLMLLDFMFKQCQIVMLSQFIDESQGMLENKKQILSELSAQYGLKVALTQDYTSLAHPFVDSKEYTLNIVGKPSSEWLEKVLAYGGASLSNIIYGDKNFGNDWLEVAVERNQKFVKWYWLKSEDEELIRLRHEVKMLCWTSDIQIKILSDDYEKKEILSFIKEVAEKYSLTIKFEKKP